MDCVKAVNIKYDCGAVTVTHNGVTYIFTQITSYNSTYTELTNGVNTLRIANSAGIDLAKIQESLACNEDVVSIDPEVVCLAPIGGGDIVTGWEVFDTLTDPPTSTLYIGGVDVSATHEVTPCVKKKFDYESRFVCVDGEQFTQVLVFDALTNNITPFDVLWLDKDGVPTIAPDPALINNVKCEAAQEVDLLKTNWLPICVDGVQWYVAEQSTYNNITGIEGLPTKIYKQGASGAIVTTAPTGTLISEGVCHCTSSPLGVLTSW